MPVYCYKCSDCEEEFESRHSMSFEDQRCINCNSEAIFKIPSLGNSKTLKVTSRPRGKVVDEYILDAKKEIKLEKTKLKSREL